MLPDRLIIDVIMTKVKSADSQLHAVKALCRRLGSPNQYTIELRTKDSDLYLGSIEFTINQNTNSHTMGYNDNSRRLSRIEVSYMRNQSAFSHVGKALFECLFKMSIRAGCEGRITLEAVRNTHYFHYKNGFRPLFRRSDEYYLRLAKALLEAGDEKIDEDLGSRVLYLPSATIKELIKKFAIDYQLTEFNTETPQERKQITIGENVIDYVIANGPLVQIYEAIQDGFSVKMDQLAQTYSPSFFTAVEDDDSISMELVDDVYDAGFKLLIGLLPVDSPKKEAKLALILLGMMKLLCSYYEHLLTPAHQSENSTFKAIFNSDKSTESNIKAIGKRIVLDKTLSLDEQTINGFFPGLGNIPEAEQLINSRKTNCIQ